MVEPIKDPVFFRVFIKLGSRSTGRRCFPAASHREVWANGAAAAVLQVNTRFPAWLGARRGSVFTAVCSRSARPVPAGRSLAAEQRSRAGSSPASGTGREISG